MCLIWFIPESPRWLVAKGRELDAQRVLAKYHTATHDETHPVVQYELSEIKASLALTATQNVGWTQLVKTSGNRKRLRIILALAFFSQWSGNGLVSYYLYDVLKGVGIDDEVTQSELPFPFTRSSTVFAAARADKPVLDSAPCRQRSTTVSSSSSTLRSPSRLRSCAIRLEG